MKKSVLLVVILAACSKTSNPLPDSSLNSPQGVTGRGLIGVGDATLEQCPAGGKVYSVFIDANANSVQDANEGSVSVQIVCNGANGSDGSNGHSLVFQILSAPLGVCPAGGSIIAMALDISDSGTYSSADPNQQALTVCNGQNGAAAPVPAYSPMDVIMPCGNTVSYKEILLRLSNGQVLAAFSENPSGLNTRLSLLPDGSYVDTDNSNCVFSLETSLDGLTRSISWLGQTQMSWPMGGL